MTYRDPERQRQYQRAWMAKRRAEFMAGKACVFCGSTERLELDHIDRHQKTHHRIWSWTKERREAEIAKCRVLCRPCHIERTKEQVRDVRRANPVTTSKLTPDDVREIRLLRAAGATFYQLATKYGVAHTTVLRAANGNAWKRIA
jgi:hypothetical protein